MSKKKCLGLAAHPSAPGRYMLAVLRAEVPDEVDIVRPAEDPEVEVLNEVLVNDEQLLALAKQAIGMLIADFGKEAIADRLAAEISWHQPSREVH